VWNQNGFNNALYDFYEAVDESFPPFWPYSKKDVRGMVQNWPKKYPCNINIIDKTHECGRIYIETF
jgi:hypothetical protein